MFGDFEAVLKFVALVIVLIGLAIGGCGGCLVGMKMGRDDMKAEAVKKGAAHWAVDEATGKVHFEWKKP